MIKAEIDRARETAAVATAPGAIGASESSTAPTGTAVSSGPQSVEVVDLWSRVTDRIVQHDEKAGRH